MFWRRRKKDQGDGGGTPKWSSVAEGGSESRPKEPRPGSIGSQVESVLDAAERAAARIREDAQNWGRDYRAQAQKEADELTSQRVRELSQLTDNLIDRAQAVAKQSDHLLTTLDETGRRILETGGRSPEALLLRNPEPAADEEHETNLDSTRQEEEQRHSPEEAKVDAGRPKPEVPQWGPPATKPEDRKEEAPPDSPGPEPDGPSKMPSASESGNDQPRPGRNDSGVSEGARLLATQMAVAGSTRDGVAKRLREEFGILDPTAILDEIGL
jgi:hypothetical protein